jgi:succinate dehydrogenase / fumarate reductase membrane anchor subunit
MSMRTPIGRVRHLGSARDGTQHWWMQRLTAVALVPLTLWFAAGVVAHVGAELSAVEEWLARPVNAAAMILFVVATFHHGQLGMQVVIEDYVHHEGLKVAAIVAVKLGSALLAVTAVVAVLLVAIG